MREAQIQNRSLQLSRQPLPALLYLLIASDPVSASAYALAFGGATYTLLKDTASPMQSSRKGGEV